jgi:hypothetical protein
VCNSFFRPGQKIIAANKTPEVLPLAEVKTFTAAAQRKSETKKQTTATTAPLP